MKRLFASGISAGAVTHETGEIWSGALATLALGLNAVLPSDYALKLPTALSDVRSVQERIARPDGLRWWKANPQSLSLCFDTSADSGSMQRLAAYTRSHYIRISQ